MSWSFPGVFQTQGRAEARPSRGALHGDALLRVRNGWERLARRARPTSSLEGQPRATLLHEQLGPKSTKLDFGHHVMVARKRDPPGALSGGGTRFCASAVDRNGSLGELAPPAVWKSKQGQHCCMNSLDQNRPSSILVNALSLHFAGAEGHFSWRVEPLKTSGNANVFCNLTRVRQGPAPGGGPSPRGRGGGSPACGGRVLLIASILAGAVRARDNQRTHQPLIH